MLGQSAISSTISKATRWGNVKTAMSHYVRKEAPRNAVMGALGPASVLTGPVLVDIAKGDMSVKRGSRSLAAISAASTLTTNIVAGGYRAVRTAIRNPNSAKTQAQIQRWENDLQGSKSIGSHLSKLAFWKKNA